MGRPHAHRTEETLREAYGVPPGIELRISGSPGDGLALAFVEGLELAARSVAGGTDTLPRSPHGGRHPLRRLHAPSGGLLVRAYRKGGLLRALRGDRFWGRWRPLDELVLLHRLGALRIPVVAAAGAVIAFGRWTWTGHLLTREVSGAADLDQWLRDACAGARAPRGGLQVLHRAGRAVRELHDAGVQHADLHPKNLLVTPDARVLVIDLDKARAFDRPLTEVRRARNLLRLMRAVDKLRLKGVPVPTAWVLRFLGAYAGSPQAGRLWFDRLRPRVTRWRSVRAAWWRLAGQAKEAR